MATFTSKNRAMIGIIIVPTPNPVNRVINDVARVTRINTRY
jgi:hypothetical protein